MSGIPLAKPGEIDIDSGRLEHAYKLLQELVREDKIPAAALCVGRKGKMIEPRFFGRHRPDDKTATLKPDALFLIASITKPVTATAVMMLVERGQVRLEDPVAKYVPRFAQNGKAAVTVRNLLTHTSGLPDMLPNNAELRAAHKSLDAFVDDVCKLKLDFEPGTAVQYQSMGILMLAEIVHQVTGVACRDFLRKQVFEPLGMRDTTLGWDPSKKSRIAAVQISPEQAKTDWNWNTPYWLNFGAPWGGLITSPADLARFCQLMLNGGKLDKERLLAPSTVEAMTRNQLECLPKAPEEDRRCRPWGLGWRFAWPGQASSYGDLLGPRAYGHSGATGTLCWIDPEADGFFILFTTRPEPGDDRYRGRVSNAVRASFI